MFSLRAQVSPGLSSSLFPSVAQLNACYASGSSRFSIFIAIVFPSRYRCLVSGHFAHRAWPRAPREQGFPFSFSLYTRDQPSSKNYFTTWKEVKGAINSFYVPFVFVIADLYLRYFHVLCVQMDKIHNGQTLTKLGLLVKIIFTFFHIILPVRSSSVIRGLFLSWYGTPVGAQEHP